jgi:hypothetical protein
MRIQDTARCASKPSREVRMGGAGTGRARSIVKELIFHKFAGVGSIGFFQKTENGLLIPRVEAC